MAAKANFYALLEARFRAAAQAPVFETPSGESMSYAELLKRVERMARALETLGVKPGDRVMAQVEKSVANVCLYLAALKAGAVFTPLNPAYTVAELEYFMADAQPALFVAPIERLIAAEPAAAANKVRCLLTMEANGSGSLADLARQQPDGHATAPCTDDDLAALIYTSGTTGRAKGAMVTHGNLASNAQALHAYWGFEPGDVLLHALPIFHVHGLFVALHTAFLNTSKVLWLPKFDLEQILRLLPQATVIMGVPTFYTRLLAHPGFGAALCRSLRLVISGSAPLLPETHAEFEARTGHKILERYGMTETGMITSNPYRDGERIAGTVGYPLPGIEVRIADEGGRILPPGEVGVLEVRGPNVFKGYWKAPDKTQQEFRPDGYFITGDLAIMAPDGRVTLVGRAKDLIITGGFNVYPKEIETELNRLPGIAESAVIGVPHPDFGEGILAVIVPAPGSAPGSESEILDALSQRLAKFKLPKRVFVAQELPRNAMGKVQKSELRARYRDAFVR
jgi:malonyl-CoA/methylmalonyl-CoA synthetase